MKKALIFTLYGNHNYGNKLQNYAVQFYLKKHGVDGETIVLKEINDKKLLKVTKNIIKSILPKYSFQLKMEKRRLLNFLDFDRLIDKVSYRDINLDCYNYIVVGSDQVWNPNDLLGQQLVEYVNTILNKNIVSLSASIALDSIPKSSVEKYKKQFLLINYLSVRESQGKKIVESITDRNDVEVLLDPTMFLTQKEWENHMKKPDMLEKFLCGKKYVLNYFLGELSFERQKIINDFAKQYDCKVINLLDKSDPFYICNPSEFLYLEKNSFLICTDSFHACVFAILFKIPFLAFDRIDNQGKMSSRIEELLEKFGLENRKFDGKITNSCLINDFAEIDKILKYERKKADDFIKKAFKS